MIATFPKKRRSSDPGHRRPGPGWQGEKSPPGGGVSAGLAFRRKGYVRPDVLSISPSLHEQQLAVLDSARR